MSMAPNPGSETFDAVARAFLEEWAQQRGNSLRRYIERYPQFEADLMLLASEMAAMEGDPPPSVTPPSAVYNALRADAHAFLMGPHQVTINSLEQQAGVSSPALASALDITVDILALLEERQVRLSSIFPQFIAHLATVLRAPVDAVRAFFAAPAPDMQTAFHAPQGHLATEPITFAAAIRESQLMTPAQKARWLQYDTDRSE